MAKTPAYKRGKYKKVDRVCEYCGETFKGTERAQFCSGKCRTYFYRKKKKLAKR